MTRTMLRWQLTAIAVALVLGSGCRDRPVAEPPGAAKADAPPPGALEKSASDSVATAAPNSGGTGTAAPDATSGEQPLAAGKGDNAKKSF